MRCYLVAVLGKAKYVATQADVAAAKREALAKGLKRVDVAVEEVEIPTAKAELLEFINDLIK